MGQEHTRNDLEQYNYPCTDVYVNKLNIYDAGYLKKVEARLVSSRLIELNQKAIGGAHDLQHWRDIHKKLFSDLYEWAGELRKNSVFSEFENPFSSPQRIEQAFSALIVPTLDKTEHFSKSTEQSIVRDVSELMGELYYIHPFRDGNTRSLVQFTKEIVRDAGFEINLFPLSIPQWHKLQDGIVQSAFERNTSVLEEILSGCISISHTREQQAEEVKSVQQHFADSVTTYDDTLKNYMQAKSAQAERLETTLSEQVDAQRALLSTTTAQRPWHITSLWSGQNWQKQHQTQQARLKVLESRLSRVQTLRLDNKKLVILAEKKLRREQQELTAHRDAALKKKREKLAQEQGQRVSLSQGKSQSRGRTHTLDR